MVVLCGASVAGQQLPPTMLAATDNVAVLQATDMVDQRVRAGNLELLRVDVDPLLPGRSYQRLAQSYGGVPVYGADITRQMDGGRARSVFGAIYEDIDIETTPTVSVEIARAVIEGLAGGPMNPGVQPELMILPLDAGGYALTYTGRVFTGTDLRVYFIDAHTGGLVQEFSGLFTQLTVGTGNGVHGDQKKISVTPEGGQFIANDKARPIDVLTYDMRGDTDRVRRVLNGSLTLRDSELALDTDNLWEDPVEVDGHVNSGWTYDFVFRHFGGRSTAGGLRIITLVHPVNVENVLSASQEDIDMFYLNSFFCPKCSSDGNGVLVYGEGIGPGFTIGGAHVGPWAGALDIVAHELMHLVTNLSSGLGARNEAGALNEAFSDIMGTAVEFFFHEPGDGPLKADYLIGEDVTDTPIAGLNRSLADPQRFGDPDHNSNYSFDRADNGGVHTNSLIVSHAYYLAVEGGTNRTSGMAVEGVGRARMVEMTEVFYRTFRNVLSSNATFSQARAATIQVAGDVDPSGGLAAALIQAWDAVGVN
jgi:Zn-dependent metalloprotease